MYLPRAGLALVKVLPHRSSWNRLQLFGSWSPYFQEKGTERLRNLPKDTQPVSSKPGLECRLNQLSSLPRAPRGGQDTHPFLGTLRSWNREPVLGPGAHQLWDPEQMNSPYF